MQYKSKIVFARRVINRVNNKETGSNEKSRKTKIGFVKVGDLSNKKAKQLDPRLRCMMFENICQICQHVAADTNKCYVGQRGEIYTRSHHI